MSPPSVTHRLDPRPRDVALTQPWPESVNIPFDELARRTHELPPRSVTVEVVGPGEIVPRTVAWLQRGGRKARVGATGEPPPSAAASAPLRLWSPNAAVVAVAGRLAPGHVLDLGCGTGRDAVYLAACGWQVTGVDRLPDALERARDLERRYAPGAIPVAWHCIDLARAPDAPAGAYDLILMLRFLCRPLLGRLAGWLRPGGLVLIETFTMEHRRRHGRPIADADVLAAGELPRLLPQLEVAEYSEAWRDDAHTARLLAHAPPP